MGLGVGDGAGEGDNVVSLRVCELISAVAGMCDIDEDKKVEVFGSARASAAELVRFTKESLS